MPFFLNVRVARKASEADGISSFELIDDAGKQLPAFSAGSHIDIVLGPGLIRQYSLCNNPAETHRYVVAVLLETPGRGGSAAMHDRVKEGDLLQISMPKNHFPLARDATNNLLLAGGIGITPILCMAEQLSATGTDFELHYCTRSKARTAFRDRIAQAPFADKVRLHFDDGDEEQKFQLTRRLAAPEIGTHLYVCGPTGFMTSVLDTARASGWPSAQLHYEFFSADVAPQAADQTFEVEVASSSRVIVVQKDKTVLQALEEAGIKVDASCEQGVCGTCLTRVLAGVPDHRDHYLTPAEKAENDKFTPCCSRSKSPRLVLDL
ncbi:MAG TPA: PDR/VanB family oxidoreductase [Paraburkholderia sp.]|uniref:PDR/VanB family oxidoreductase n=1 Tax=Paraburkholderia sp. TaxID=1926495 RepID=UPI002B45A744|nr:PDR/VanB family oxidoreductase [Paraburkholderia sp.]HKR46925.1 PDR/VanB family oxidoreductase [Paraburkholderia sp.]